MILDGRVHHDMETWLQSSAMSAKAESWVLPSIFPYKPIVDTVNSIYSLTEMPFLWWSSGEHIPAFAGLFCLISLRVSFVWWDLINPCDIVFSVYVDRFMGGNVFPCVSKSEPLSLCEVGLWCLWAQSSCLCICHHNAVNWCVVSWRHPGQSKPL